MTLFNSKFLNIISFICIIYMFWHAMMPSHNIQKQKSSEYNKIADEDARIQAIKIGQKPRTITMSEKIVQFFLGDVMMNRLKLLKVNN